MSKYNYVDEMIEKGYIKDTIYEVYQDKHIFQLNEIFKYFVEMFNAPIERLGIDESDKCFHLESCKRYDRDGEYKLYGEIIYKYFPQSNPDDDKLYELSFLKYCPLLYINLNKRYSKGDTIEGVIDGEIKEYNVVDSYSKPLTDDSGEYIELVIHDDKANIYEIRYTLTYYTQCDSVSIIKLKGDD